MKNSQELLNAFRPEYEQLKRARMRLKRAMRNYNGSYKQLEKITNRHRDLLARIFKNVDESSSFEELKVSFIELRDAKVGHEILRREMTAARDALEQIEREYIIGVFRNLIEEHGLNAHNISQAFGVHYITLKRWLDADEGTRQELCDDENVN